MIRFVKQHVFLYKIGKNNLVEISRNTTGDEQSLDYGEIIARI